MCRFLLILMRIMPHKDPEARKAYQRAYRARLRAEQPEKVKAAKAASYQKHAEAVKAKAAEYRKTYVDTTGAERMGRYRASHPERVAIDNHARRARKLNTLSIPFTDEEMLGLYGSDCHICLEPIDLDAPRQVGIEGWERGLHREHVVSLSQGGTDTLGNVKPAHGLCNLRKGSRV